jgi:aryl-alcohol dehydrogenase-like predicted oxidoreductase
MLGHHDFGQQNTEAEGHEQMDYALEKELIFGTAEMYSVPAREETYGDTERIIGTWFKKTGRREEVVLASKIAGPNPNYLYAREE